MYSLGLSNLRHPFYNSTHKTLNNNNCREFLDPFETVSFRVNLTKIARSEVCLIASTVNQRLLFYKPSRPYQLANICQLLHINNSCSTTNCVKFISPISFLYFISLEKERQNTFICHLVIVVVMAFFPPFLYFPIYYTVIVVVVVVIFIVYFSIISNNFCSSVLPLFDSCFSNQFQRKKRPQNEPEQVNIYFEHYN